MFHFNPRSSAGYGDGGERPLPAGSDLNLFMANADVADLRGVCHFRKPFPLVTMARRYTSKDQSLVINTSKFQSAFHLLELTIEQNHKILMRSTAKKRVQRYAQHSLVK